MFSVFANFPFSLSNAGASPAKVPDTADLLQVALGLAVVLTVIAVITWLLRRFGGMNASLNGKLKVLGAISLGARERAVLVQVGEQQILLGVAPGRVQTLHVLNAPLPETPNSLFSSALELDREVE
ncbi:flagellar protein FliO/FliZ [Gammaproteobacteria bacterium]